MSNIFYPDIYRAHSLASCIATHEPKHAQHSKLADRRTQRPPSSLPTEISSRSHHPCARRPMKYQKVPSRKTTSCELQLRWTELLHMPWLSSLVTCSDEPRLKGLSAPNGTTRSQHCGRLEPRKHRRPTAFKPLRIRRS